MNIAVKDGMFSRFTRLSKCPIFRTLHVGKR
jgi:hypothetical protein